ncbi:MAG: UDP-N-acetylglucosamine 2-epimerase (non-hydrolyzing) [Flavobacteriales bacterium]|nr:UDP-N-acetylglucosamine 2-epimerase (non-hydrolyzing) [Flavobacteriales bacterium]|tara:strand:+ start:839 stop:1945 length:1107 start_codon:yes stop_codon:yes gene_type:complete
MKKILTVLGARPQVIKSAAITRVIRSEFVNQLKEIVLNTGQHYDANMNSVFFEELFLPVPKYDESIDLKHPFPINQMISGIEKAIHIEHPDVILVYGDTNSTLAGAISAVKNDIPLVHVEAGLRSFNIDMPEEGNRILTDHSSRLLFSPTFEGVRNLKKECINSSFVFHCGDIMYDNSLYYHEKAKIKSKILQENGLIQNDFILFTCHRPSNTDSKQNLTQIFQALKILAETNNKKIVFPVHPRTKKQVLMLFGESFLKQELSDFLLLPPVSFLDTIMLISNADIIVTDSGGIQKEAYFFNKKSLILREETEWVEIIEEKAGILVGVEKKRIIEGYSVIKGLEPSFKPIFGDGMAGLFICQTILKELK